MGNARVNADHLLTSRDAQALLGIVVERLEPTDAGRPAMFVCFGASRTRPAIVCELVSLASAPTSRRRDVPFVSVAVRAERDESLPRRSIEAQWEQRGLKFALTYTCVAETDDDEAAERTAGKRGAIAALARVVSERLAALPSSA